MMERWQQTGKRKFFSVVIMTTGKLLVVIILIALITAANPLDMANSQSSGVEPEDVPRAGMNGQINQPESPSSVYLPHVVRTPILDAEMKITGKKQVVYDWTSDRCDDHTIPDLPMRAFRDKNGQVQAILSSESNYRMLGSDLDDLTVDCDPVKLSKYNPDPSLYRDAEWVAAPYTNDGQTVYALVHNEYRGHTHPGMCPQGEYFPCWDNSITLAVSTDTGGWYEPISTEPDHLVARFPYPYEAGKGPEGFRSPSNIIQGPKGFYYSFIHVSEYGTQEQWVCLMRTDDLSDPESWRFWDGSGFAGQFADPYRDDISDPQDHICPPVALDQIGASLNDSITYNTYLNAYVLVGISADWLDEREVWGFYYSTSTDLVNWTRRKLLLEVELPWTVDDPGSDVSYLYPSLLDPDSASRNFETTDQTAYLYYTRNNFGHASLDRDLIRVLVEFSQ